ncbi:MAG: GGDEF domain-containing protein [Pyrinomonadaceae bacterium]
MNVSSGGLTSRYQNSRVALSASTVTILISGVVLLGWLFGIESFKRIFPTFVAMNPTTAVAFMLLGVALWLSQTKDVAPGVLLIARVCSALSALIGLLKLGEVLFGWAIGIDQLLFADRLRFDPTGQPNRIAPNTALNFVLLGCALLLFWSKFRRGYYLAQALIIIALIDSLLPIMGYLYGTKLFYGIGSFIPMALHTAIAFFVLGTGILFAHPASALMMPLMDKGVSGLMVRRLLPAVIVLPVVIGWLRLEGLRRGFYDNELGVALMVVAHIFIFAVLVWWNSFLLFRLDLQRKQVESQLHDLTLTDDLTGLRNRRGFLLLTEQEMKLARNKRIGIGLWLLFADLDGLKQINDSLGHQAGSQAIAQTGEILKRTFRESDVLARLGGDEFAVLALSDDADGGRIMLARLQDNISAFNVTEKLPYQLSVSVGVVRVDPDKAASIEDAIKEADQAMYDSKHRKKSKLRLNHTLDNRFA